MTTMTKPERVLVLEEAARLTSGARDATYGPPLVNLSASGELKAVMRSHLVRDLSFAELEALDMVLTKIGRIITGPEPHRDNYVDASAYMAIAWEAADADKKDIDEVGKLLDSLFHPQGRDPVVWPDDEKPSDS
jgi:hypothetical protein